MKRNKHRNRILTAVFILFLVLPLLTVRFTGNELSETENRYLAPFPTLLVKGKLNPEFPSTARLWLEDHIGFRRELITLSSAVKWKLFHQSPSTQVHLGADGWCYYTIDENLELVTGRYSLPDEMLEEMLQMHLEIRDRLAAQGIEYVVILTPSKATVYPEYLRYGDGTVHDTPVDLVADYLTEHSDLHVIQVKDALLEAKESDQVFFKMDTHWNYVGAYTAYKKVAEDLKTFGLIDTDPVQVTRQDTEYLGDFVPLMGLTGLMEPEQTQDCRILSPGSRMDQNSGLYRKLVKTVNSFKSSAKCYHFRNKNIAEGTAMTFGDSMFGDWHIPKYLAEHFHEHVFIWDYDLHQEYLDLVQPDVVLFQMTERYLNTFTQTNAEFLERENYE